MYDPAVGALMDSDEDACVAQKKLKATTEMWAYMHRYIHVVAYQETLAALDHFWLVHACIIRYNQRCARYR